jgi:hypothetical protein
VRTLHWSDGVFPAPRAMPARPVRHVRPASPTMGSRHLRQWHPPALALALSLGMTVAEVAPEQNPAGPGAILAATSPDSRA